jgi:hypothetical protein
MNENKIAQLALERLHERTGLAGKWQPLQYELDGKVDFYFQGKDEIFFAEVKTELRHHQLPKLLDMANRHAPFIVIAENIFPTLKEILRQHNIGYLDTAGNIFIHTPDHYIWIDGNKTVTEKKGTTNRAFTKTGLKTVFYLLLNKDAINMPYRILAEITDVALGNIKNVMEGLKEAGFILQVNDKTMYLQNKKTLLERWITGYGETLKPTLYIGTYKFWDNNKFRNWQTLPFEVGENFWGGEPAAEHLTNYLTPAVLTVYTERKAPLVTKWTLIPDEQGNIYFYKKFWKNEQVDNEKFAPPLLVYADLILTDNPRCLETAQIIYDKYLKNEFG